MKEDRMMTILGGLTALMGILAISVGRWIMGGIIMLLSFGIFWNRGFGKFNDRSIYEKVIKTDLSIQEMYEKLKNTDTPLGKAWIAGHKGFEGDSIIFGPDVFKDCVVISRKGKNLDVKHITLVGNIIRDESDEYRFSNFIDASETEVTPKRYSIFASFKLALVMLVKHLADFIEAADKDRYISAPDRYDIFKFYYHNSTAGYFLDEEDNEILRAESEFAPFRAAVFDADGNEMASVKPRAFDRKGIIIESAGFDIFADGEYFGEITKKRIDGTDVFTADTDAGVFTITNIPAVRRANIACNYVIEQDGKIKAVVGGSPNILFDTVGRCQNDIVLSYDDDYLVLYSVIELFLLALNKKFLK